MNGTKGIPRRLYTRALHCSLICLEMRFKSLFFKGLQKFAYDNIRFYLNCNPSEPKQLARHEDTKTKIADSRSISLSLSRRKVAVLRLTVARA